MGGSAKKNQRRNYSRKAEELCFNNRDRFELWDSGWHRKMGKKQNKRFLIKGSFAACDAY